MKQSFRAIVVDKDNGIHRTQMKRVLMTELPVGDVLIKVLYSGLNYKDGLAVTGKGQVIRTYPMIPGIDFAGIVESSASSSYREGDAVLLTGWGAGVSLWGGYAEYAHVPAEWLIPLPKAFDFKQAMAIGTAGLTAMLCVQALEGRGLASDHGQVVVSGASGGVGSFAVMILASLGYQVVASSGKPHIHAYLNNLGASCVIERTELIETAAKPLSSERWAGAVDTVGGKVLAGILSASCYGSSVAACGLTGGNDLSMTLFPFILRGVSLLGIDSVKCPTEQRFKAWSRLSECVSAELIERITQVITLEEVPEAAKMLVEGNSYGRIVVDLHATS